MKFSKLLVTISLTVAMLSCEKNDMGIVDAQTETPQLSLASVAPDSIYIDNLTPSAELYLISTVVNVKATIRSGNQSVIAAVIGPVASQEVHRATLRDDGASPDQVANDSMYSARIEFRIRRKDFGAYRIQLISTSAAGVQSNVVERRLLLARTNSQPAITNPGIRPNTPPGSFPDSIRVLLTIAASDSDGIADIERVSVRARNTTDSSARSLFDTGSPANGDQVAGDGMFSGLIWIRPTMMLQNVEFVFSASDARNASSNEVRRSYANRPPIILNLNVPSTIQRPTSGSRLIPFFQAVADSDGLGDIDSVYFKNVSSTTPVNILMYDDGDLVVHGDSVANNGVYSRLVTIDASTSAGQKEFRFFVQDRFGAKDSLVKIITIN